MFSEAPSPRRPVMHRNVRYNCRVIFLNRCVAGLRAGLGSVSGGVLGTRQEMPATPPLPAPAPYTAPGELETAGEVWGHWALERKVRRTRVGFPTAPRSPMERYLLVSGSVTGGRPGPPS